MVNLSVSDCLTCLLYLILNIRRISSHLISGFFIDLMVGVSFVSIASISIDRFLMVSYPIRHRILMKGKILVLWIAAICLFSSLSYYRQLCTRLRITS